MSVEERNISNRDMTLVNILERLANQIRQCDIRLEEIEKYQSKLSSSLENIKFRQNLRQDEISATVEKLEQNFMRYRSDILSLVNEQDRIGNSIKEMARKQAALFDGQENIIQNLNDLDARYGIQEKTVRDHSIYSIQQREALSKELSDTNSRITKLHMDTEKHLLDQYQEVRHQVQELRLETMRRLLAFDGIESALNTLLFRTEPPPPKELPKIIRLFYNGFVAIRGKLSWLLRNVSGWLRKKFGRIK